ncbi:MAG: hypothetical protein PHO67_08120 [Candidatus Omnitrophica bacterium]|nr:hypothetical protein [Candidatus Omnitrophota bacterium]
MVQNRSGIRKQSAVVVSPVTGAAAALYNITPGRTAIIRRIMWTNACGAGSNLSLGQGLAGAFAAVLPPIVTLTGLDGQLEEGDFPNVEIQWTAALPAITFESTVLGISVTIEVEEI